MATQISIGCDHAGFPYKKAILTKLQNAGYTTQDHGTHGPESVDYPDFVHPVAEDLRTGNATLGIVLCGSGNGVAMTANKYPHVRAALCWQRDLAELARQHNNANILAIPVRFVSEETALDMVEGFLQSEFEGGRHQRRVDKMTKE